MSPDAAELLSVIVLAMACEDPAVGMDVLADGVAIVLRGQRAEPDPTILRPLGLDEPPRETPPGWDFADPEMQAIMRLGYRDSAEYQYAMAARERALREG